MTGINEIAFGVEIETYGLGREGTINTLVREFGWRRGNAGNCAVDFQGRTWKAVPDGSLSGPNTAELVTPVLGYADIELLQEIARKLRTAGARVNASCGIHIHVDAGAFDAKALVRIVKLFANKERLLKHAFEVLRSRGESYCWDMNRRGFLDRLYTGRAPQTLEELNRRWYGRTEAYDPQARHDHYNSTRYHALNLHNVWYRGTVEFRLFNATLHAGKIKAYIQFCLALAAKAINGQGAAGRPRTDFNADTAKYDFRTFLIRLGLIGDEFKTCRKHLTKHLKGNASWKNGRPEVAAAPAPVVEPEGSEDAADDELMDWLHGLGWRVTATGLWIHPDYRNLTGAMNEYSLTDAAARAGLMRCEAVA